MSSNTETETELSGWEIVFGILGFTLCLCRCLSMLSKDEENNEQPQPQTAVRPSPTASSPPSTNKRNEPMSANEMEKCLVERMKHGVILQSNDDHNNESHTFADFGTDDPISVESCVICLIRYEEGERVVTSACEHVFHRDCVLEWVMLNKQCPCCRQLFVDPEAPVVQPVLELDRLDSR